MDIREIKISNPLDYAMRKIEEDKIVPNPVINTEKYDKYLSLLQDLCEFCDKGKRARHSFDSPETTVNLHTVEIILEDPFLEGKDKETFLRILSKFDCFGIESIREDVSILGMVKDIYVSA